MLQSYFNYSRQGRILDPVKQPWYKPSKRQPHKMVKNTKAICRQKLTNCLSVFDHFLVLALKGVNTLLTKPLTIFMKKFHRRRLQMSVESQRHLWEKRLFHRFLLLPVAVLEPDNWNIPFSNIFPAYLIIPLAELSKRFACN